MIVLKNDCDIHLELWKYQPRKRQLNSHCFEDINIVKRNLTNLEVSRAECWAGEKPGKNHVDRYGYVPHDITVTDLNVLNFGYCGMI